jgi:hypothetical protein
MNPAEMEAPRALRKPGDTDAVTFSWADADAGLFGLARVAGGAGADGATSASALAVAFSGRDTLGALAESGPAPPAVLVAETDAPLERWSVRADGDVTFELSFEAVTAPVAYGGRHALVKAGGMEGYEQLCRVSGSVNGTPMKGVGQRGHSWGNPDWDKIALTRAVGAWFADGTGVALATVRGVKASNHADEARWGAAFVSDGATEIDDVRLSTTSDEQGRQIRAGLELCLDKDDEFPFRGVGEVVTGSTLELGALRLDVAFFRWHVDGRTGHGRYDVIRRAA